MKLTAASISALGLLTVCLEAAEPVTGFWKFSVKDESTGEVGSEEFLVLKSNKKLKIYDKHSFEQWRQINVKQSNEASAFVEIPGAALGIGSKTNVSVRVQVKDGKLFGNPAAGANKGIDFKAYRSQTAWLCGNHKPTNHLASSTTERQEYGSKYGCKLWGALNDKNAEVGVVALAAKEDLLGSTAQPAQ